jgi:hypothetical protein
MNLKTEIALRSCIRKWKRNVKIAVAGRIPTTGQEHCPLCTLFYTEADGCKGCPIRKKTGEDYCGGSPHDSTVFCSMKDRANNCQKEVDFLVSLLPKKRKPA